MYNILDPDWDRVQPSALSFPIFLKQPVFEHLVSHNLVPDLAPNFVLIIKKNGIGTGMYLSGTQSCRIPESCPWNELRDTIFKKLCPLDLRAMI